MLSSSKQDLQAIARHILSEGYGKPVGTLGALKEDEIDLSVLLELSDSQWQELEDPVSRLYEVCRLLIKQGDTRSLYLAFQLSFRVHDLERAGKEPWYPSCLYKGVAQVGLGHIDIGVKSILIGMSEKQGYTPSPGDQSLGHWALVSATIATRNLALAVQFAGKWKESADEAGLPEEALCAEMALCVFQLLFGNGEEAARIEERLVMVPNEWESAATFLTDWSKALIDGTEPPTTSLSEPYPLFLGLQWYGDVPDEDYDSKDSREDFTRLCTWRNRFPGEASIRKHLSEEQLIQYGALLSRWELEGPLRSVEAVLKEKSPDQYFRMAMERVLGRHALERIALSHSVEPDRKIREKAIILMMDVRGFSTMSEDCPPEQILDILGPVYKIMNEEFEQAGGMIHEFVGDSIMVVFNTFEGQHTDMDTILFHTIRCLERIRTLNALSLQTGLPEIQVGFGINKGPVAVGYLGGLSRCHLAVLGNTTNVTARLEGMSKDLPGVLVVSGDCFDHEEPGVWATPQRVNFSVRDVGHHSVKNVARPIRLFCLNPLLRYWIDFVPMGFVATPERGIVYIDAGNSGKPGIIDHHYTGYEAKSACELLIRKPELLLGHLADIQTSEIEFRLHQGPDLDCAATLYTAFELMEKNPRKELLEDLARYVSLIDQGIIPEADRLVDSLYGVFIAHQDIIKKKQGMHFTDYNLLEAGLRLIDAAVYLMEKNRYGADLSYVFQFQPDWFAEEKRLIREDRERYKEDLSLRSLTYEALVNGSPEPVTGLWLDHPKSVLFKLWSRNDPMAPGAKGYPFLAVNWSLPDRNRFVISVDPESGTHLEGLGQLLEKEETRKRKELGKERPVHPIRHPSNNADPWYFGQGHGYTIVDAPRDGTVLTADEVRDTHTGWRKSQD